MGRKWERKDETTILDKFDPMFLLFSFGFCLLFYLLLFSFLSPPPSLFFFFFFFFSFHFIPYATSYSFCLFHFRQNCPLSNSLSSSFFFFFYIYIYVLGDFFILLFSLICFGFLYFFLSEMSSIHNFFFLISNRIIYTYSIFFPPIFFST